MKKNMMKTLIIGTLFILSTSNLFAESLIEVFPTGDQSVDVKAVRNAVTNVDLGGMVLLKATNQEGVSTAFNFGQMEYDFTYPPNNPLALADINNHRVQINKGVVIQGETTGFGQMTTIQNGYQSFTIGATTAPNSDVTIQGLHFRDAGMAGIVVARTSADYKVTIKYNKFTGRLYDFFNFKSIDKPYWIPNTTNPWGNGNGILMMNDQGKDVTTDYTQGDRKEAWKKAFAYMYYMPIGPSPFATSWFTDAILVGAFSAPGQVMGPVHITNNYMNLEEESSLTSEFEKVWHETFVIFFLGSKGDALISQNIIKNGSARDINLLDLTGKISVKGNEIEMGPLGSYHLNDPFSPLSVPPFLSKAAIAAAYKFFFLGFPAKGGDISIAENTITSSFPSMDAGGIGVIGINNSAWNSATIEANDITIRNGRHGIFIADTGATVGEVKTNGATVLRNKIRGSGLYAMRIGNSIKDPLNPEDPKDPKTADNLFQANNIAKFHASAAGTSSTTLPSADVYLDADTRDNILVGYSGTVIDKGEGNKITGQPRTIRGGVGSAVSKTMRMKFYKR